VTRLSRCCSLVSVNIRINKSTFLFYFSLLSPEYIHPSTNMHSFRCMHAVRFRLVWYTYFHSVIKLKGFRLGFSVSM